MSVMMSISIFDGGVTYVKADNNAGEMISDFISEDSYSLKINKVNEKTIKIIIRNKSSENIKNLRVDMLTDANPVNSNFGTIKRNYDYLTVDSSYMLYSGYSKEIEIEFQNKVDLSEIKEISIFGDRIAEDGEYDNVCFTSTANLQYTEEIIGNNKKIVNCDEKESTINIEIEKQVGNDEYNYRGRIILGLDGIEYNVEVTGELFVSEEGILGTLVGKTDDDTPISATINYTNANENPYVFVAIGDVTTGNDKYMIFGNRKEANDELSNKKIEESENIGADKVQMLEECDSMIIQSTVGEKINEDEEKIDTVSEATSAYDTVFQGMAWSGYSYKGEFYPLISTCLYSPSKQKSNCTYCIRGKVNEQMGNADYYIKTVCLNPGIVMYHNSTAKLEMYTGNSNVKLSELDPETTGVLTFSASIPVPYLNASVEYFDVSFPSISAKRYKINSSTKYNKAVWKFNNHVSCSFSADSSSSKYPKKIKKAYSGQCDTVYYRNANSSYNLYCNGYVYYSGTIRFGVYETDYSFNCSSGMKKVITTVTNS